MLSHHLRGQAEWTEPENDVTDKVAIPNISATRARRAARKLRNFGVLAHFDAAERALVVFVTKQGEDWTRNLALKVLAD